HDADRAVAQLGGAQRELRRVARVLRYLEVEGGVTGRERAADQAAQPGRIVLAGRRIDDDEGAAGVSAGRHWYGSPHPSRLRRRLAGRTDRWQAPRASPRAPRWAGAC